MMMPKAIISVVQTCRAKKTCDLKSLRVVFISIPLNEVFLVLLGKGEAVQMQMSYSSTSSGCSTLHSAVAICSFLVE